MSSIRRYFIPAVFLLLILIFKPACFNDNSGGGSSDALIADHNSARLAVLESIPDVTINNVKSDLHIAYGHTSHGSQIVDGVNGLVAFMNGRGCTADLYDGIDLRTDMGGYGYPYGAADLNQPDYTTWESATRSYLAAHTDINVVIWSWCAGVSHASGTDIENYLSLMSGLDRDYPDIKFIYMTGHLDGTGITGTLHVNNERIRQYCRDNGKCLFDFADIESYDPEGDCYLAMGADDACDYSGGNWATAWQGSHTEDVEWYNCNSEHSQPLNANMKAYAFWWLMAKIAGWGG